MKRRNVLIALRAMSICGYQPTVGELAKVSGVSRSTAYRQISKACGDGLATYIETPRQGLHGFERRLLPTREGILEADFILRREVLTGRELF